MTTGSIVGPLFDLIDRIIPDDAARDAAKLALLREENGAGLARVAATLATARAADPWNSRARPAFLYVMYALLLWSVPMGLVAAVRPAMATAMIAGMTAYLNGIPESLYALFGTGYLGYTAARSWGKAKGVER